MSRMALRLIAAVAVACSLAACSRDDKVLCEDGTRYSSADSIPPVRIPDDLSPPDEAGSLRLPPPVRAASPPPAGRCLEQPPPFFEDRTP